MIYDPLIHSRPPRPTTYVHNLGFFQHPAFTVARPYDPGELVDSHRLLWPKGINPGDPVKCGTCGNRLWRGNERRTLPIADEVFLG